MWCPPTSGRRCRGLSQTSRRSWPPQGWVLVGRVLPRALGPRVWRGRGGTRLRALLTATPPTFQSASCLVLRLLRLVISL